MTSQKVKKIDKEIISNTQDEGWKENQLGSGLMQKKSDALLVKAFVNCKYYWYKKVIKLLLVRSLRQLQVLHVDICSFFLVYVVLFCFLCCNLMIGHMAYNVPWDFQIDDCKISRIYISYKSCYIAQSA